MPVQNKPIIHGRDHETDGADPIRGLLPPAGDTLDEKILAVAPDGFWKLNETTGSTAQDSSGNDLDMSSSGYQNPLWGAPAGPPGQVAANFQVGTSGVGGDASRVARDWSVIDHSFTAGVWVNRNDTTISMVIGQGNPHRGSGHGWMIWLNGPGVTSGVPEFHPSAKMIGAADDQVVALNPLLADVWAFLAITYNSTSEEVKLYVNGLLSATGDATGWDPITEGATPDSLWIAHDGGLPGSAGIVPNSTTLSYAFLVHRALSGAELLDIYEAPTDDPTGDVITIDPITGEPIWAPPGTEVEHGDGEEDEDPRDEPGTWAGSPENASGWHYQAHYEYVVLYDSNPGRFDVPSRKWVRVPFNTVRIQRTWELEVDGYSRTSWLPDDRGLSEHAKQGVLLVTPGMTFNGGPLALEEEVSGWFSVEYPMLNPAGLPDYTGGPIIAPDHYARGARMTNATTGQVLRAGEALPEHPSWRVFFDWPFYSPADGDEGIWFVNADNPFPFYPVWAARPLNKPLPYPKYSSAESLENYQDSAGNPGFGHADIVSRTLLEAGAALTLQAWQDTPWPLRFGTDKYPPYTPPTYSEKWRRRPSLVVFHYYDPDTVDHDTGALL